MNLTVGTLDTFLLLLFCREISYALHYLEMIFSIEKILTTIINNQIVLYLCKPHKIYVYLTTMYCYCR